MRASENGGYWLYLPKPWKSREFADIGDRKCIAKKCKRLEDMVNTIKTVKKKRRNYTHYYSEGESLFLLPKSLSNGVRLWKNYETRLKSWLADRSSSECTSQQAQDDRENYSVRSHESSALTYHSSFYEEDPLRGFYTIWHFNAAKVPKNKLSTTENICEFLDSISKSVAVEHHISKPPRGGVSGKIDDPSMLSAKGRDTLQRWSRLASHYDAGQESGEDEDPVEVWNRMVEASVLRNGTTDDSLSSPTCLPSLDLPKNAAKTKSRRSKNLSLDSPDVVCSPETRLRKSNTNKRPDKQLQAVSEEADNPIHKCENRPITSCSDPANALELNRTHSLRLAFQATGNTPAQKPNFRKNLVKVHLTRKLESPQEAKGSAMIPIGSKPSLTSAKRNASNNETPKSTANDSLSITLSSLRKRKTGTPKTEERTLKIESSQETSKNTSLGKAITLGATVKTPASFSKCSSELDTTDRSFTKRRKRSSFSTPKIESPPETSKKSVLRTPSAKRANVNSSPSVKSCKRF